MGCLLAHAQTRVTEIQVVSGNAVPGVRAYELELLHARHRHAHVTRFLANPHHVGLERFPAIGPDLHGHGAFLRHVRTHARVEPEPVPNAVVQEV